jgi:predicted RNA-binding protein
MHKMRTHLQRIHINSEGKNISAAISTQTGTPKKGVTSTQVHGNKALITERAHFQTCEHEMCEFNVILNGETLFKDVVYAKNEGNNVIAKSVLGETREFKNCKITEVNVNTTKLVLTAAP